MQTPGLDQRHRDKNGKISRKHANTVIGTLRKAYGRHFAPGERDDVKLSDILHKLGDESLRKLIRETEKG
jgi:hypothetical protein